LQTSSCVLLQASPACTCRHAKPAAAPEASTTAAIEGKDPSQTAAEAAAKISDAEAEAAAAAETVAQASKEDRIAAAREKFLARKRQKTGG